MNNGDFSKSPATLEELIDHLPRTYTDDDIQLIRSAYDVASEAHADVPRASGEPYIIHPAGGGRHPGRHAPGSPRPLPPACCTTSPKTPMCPIDDIGKRFGADVAGLVDGVTKLEKIGRISLGEDKDARSQQAARRAADKRAKERREQRARQPPLAQPAR